MYAAAKATHSPNQQLGSLNNRFASYIEKVRFLEEQNKITKAGRSNNELNSSKLKNEFPDMLSIRDSIIKFVFEPVQNKL